MLESKYCNKIIIIIVSLAVLFCFGCIVFSESIHDAFGNSGVTMEYESELFDTSEVIDLNITMDEDEWQDLLDNAIDEEYHSCDITINGTTFKNVAIRAKGNTSLSNIANDDTTDRYSFKIEFDKYDESQSCFGLDKLVLNNNYADATNMKEAVVYDMFSYLGADASLYNYAKISVNGEYWGVYLALEGVEDSFMLRNYGVDNGELYKPESMGIGGGDKADGMEKPNGNMQRPEMNGDMQRPNMNGEGVRPGKQNNQNTQEGQDSQTDMTPPEMQDNQTDMTPPDMQGNQMDMTPPEMPDGNPEELNVNPDDNNADGNNQAMQRPDNMQMGNGQNDKNGGRSGNGADLNYIDDDVDSYSTIWDGEVTNTGDKDHEKVVTALKNISEQNDLETYMDVDNMLRYMAVQTFVVNLDSLTGTMAHNYYLYEQSGKLNLIPWDYNLSFGGFQSGNASDTINFPIDTPFSGNLTLEDRQFFKGLLENEEYLAKYHEYLNKLCDEYINGGKLDELYNRIRSQIDELVETDPSAFYTYDEYDAGANMLYKTLMLRAESIEGQLDGTIPSTTEAQKMDSSSLIDSSEINLSVMGVMNNGGNKGGNNGGNIKPPNMQNNGEQITPPDLPVNAEDNSQQMTPPDMNDADTNSADIAQNNNQNANGNPPNMDNMHMQGMNSQASQTLNKEAVMWMGICTLAIAVGLIIVKLYKRR